MNPRSKTRAMNSQSAFFFANEIRKAMRGITRALQIVDELTQKESSANYHAERQTTNEKPIEALFQHGARRESARIHE